MGSSDEGLGTVMYCSIECDYEDSLTKFKVFYQPWHEFVAYVKDLVDPSQGNICKGMDK